MESRSIDTAQDASIDLMTLNQKIVNMRATVRRSRGNIINKLTRNIADLKKKKGTEEEKKKNLEKAQRYLNEIESLRNLKDDKVTKYALANMSTFEEVSKSTTSSAARALARFADSKLMKQAVDKFREEHSDWRDLAAFLLVKQTGRRFKSRKQKEKTASRLENISASRLMTEAFNHGLFRDEEFQKLERTIEKKKINCDKSISEDQKEVDVSISNKTKEISLSDGCKENDNVTNKSFELSGRNRTHSRSSQEEECDKSSIEKNIILMNNKKETGKQIQNKNEMTSQPQSSSTLESNQSLQKNKKPTGIKEIITSGKQKTQRNHKDTSLQGDVSANSVGKNQENIEEEDEDKEEDKEVEGEESEEIDEESIDEENDGESSEEESINEEISEEPPMKINKRDKECVVKEFEIGSDNSENDSDEDVISESEDADENDSSEKKSDNLKKNIKEGGTGKKSLRKKGKRVPDFLMKGEDKPQRLPRDPFFEGWDGVEDDDDLPEDDFTEAVEGEDDCTDIHEKFVGNKQMTKSLFYRPGDKKKPIKSKTQSANSGKPKFKFGESQGKGNNKSFDKTEKHLLSSGKKSHQSSTNNPGRTYSPAKSPAGPVAPPKLAEKLHPSWEASRKRKAEQSGGIRAFAGTKITFED